MGTHSRPKHVEKRNKCTKKNFALSWLYLQDSNNILTSPWFFMWLQRFCFLHCVLWYNYTPQTNDMHNFLNQYLIFISIVSYMFWTSWVHSQGDSCMGSTVRLTCISVRSLFEHTLLSTRLLTPMHAKHTILHTCLSHWGWIQEVRNL